MDFAHHSTSWESLTNPWPPRTNQLSPSYVSAPNPSCLHPLSWGAGVLLMLPIGGARERMDSGDEKAVSGFPVSVLLSQTVFCLLSGRQPWPCPFLRDPSIFLSATCCFFLWLHQLSCGSCLLTWGISFCTKPRRFEIPRVISDFLTGSWPMKLVESPSFPRIPFL